MPRLHQEILEIQQRLLGRAHVDKRGCDARLAAPARAPDLVYIVLDLLGHGKDDDVLNVSKVEPFGRNAGCDHDVLGARFERLDGVLTFFLRCMSLVSQAKARGKKSLTFRSVDCDGLDTLEQEVFLYICTSQQDKRGVATHARTVDLVLVLAKDDHGRRRLLQTFEEVDHLGFLLDVLDDLEHVQVGSARTSDVDKHGPDKRLLRKVLNLARHRGGKEERLALALPLQNIRPNTMRVWGDAP